MIKGIALSEYILLAYNFSLGPLKNLKSRGHTVVRKSKTQNPNSKTNSKNQTPKTTSNFQLPISNSYERYTPL